MKEKDYVISLKIEKEIEINVKGFHNLLLK